MSIAWFCGVQIGELVNAFCACSYSHRDKHFAGREPRHHSARPIAEQTSNN